MTTASEEARGLYVEGRERADQLRAHDAHELFTQAAAKDSNFALAQYDLALTAPTTVAFQGYLDRAVALSGQASEGERLMIQALQARSNGDSKQSLALTEELVARYPRDARAHGLLATGYMGQQVRPGRYPAHAGPRSQAGLRARLQPAGVRLPAAAEVR